MKIKYTALFLTILFLAGALLSASLLNGSAIGTSESPGFQGEIFLQENTIYNVKIGNALRFYNTGYMNYPHGEKLHFAVANSFHQFMYVPLRLFFDSLDSFNILVILIVLLNFASAYLLSRYIFSSRPIAVLAGLIYAVSPYILLKIHLGFIQKIAVFWIPLYFLMLLKLRTERSIKYVILASLALSAQQFFYPPYSYYLIIFTLLSMSYLVLRPAERIFVISRFVLMISLFLIATSLIYYLIGLGFPYLDMPDKSVFITDTGNLDLFNPFKFHPYNSDSYRIHLALGMGIIPFILALAGLFRHKGLPRLLSVPFFSFLILMAGPYLVFKGHVLTIAGYKVLLPYYFISKYLPFASGIYFPMRLFPLATLCLSIMAGFGAMSIASLFKKRKSTAVVLIAAILYLFELAVLFPETFPPKINKVYTPEIYKRIESEGVEAVLNLPQSSQRKIINLYGLYSALSGTKLMNAYNDKNFKLNIPKESDPDETKSKFIEMLAAGKVGYIIVHIDLLKESEKESFIKNLDWLSKFCELYDYHSDGIIAYRLPALTDIKEWSESVYVPFDYDSINSAIEHNERGYDIVVAPGIYYENINFKGRAVKLRSAFGPKATVIDGRGLYSTVSFISGEGRDSAIDGFTIRNGIGLIISDVDRNSSKKTRGGGIICAAASSPTITNNIIEHNAAENGGGICCFLDSSPLIKNNIIRYNKASKGGGIRCSIGSSPDIVSNMILENTAYMSGGGLYWRMGSYPKISGNLIKANAAVLKGGGIFGASYHSSAESHEIIISDSIIIGNTSPEGSAIDLDSHELKINIVNCLIDSLDGIYDPKGTIINKEGFIVLKKDWGF